MCGKRAFPRRKCTILSEIGGGGSEKDKRGER